MALTFPSRCGESNLPDSVAAVGGSPPDDISCCAPSIGGQRTPWGVIKMPEKSSLTPATESIVLIKGELWLSADKSRRRGGVREEDSEGQRQLAGVLGIRGSSLVMLTGSPKSRHFAASFKHFICMKCQHSVTYTVSLDSRHPKLLKPFCDSAEDWRPVHELLQFTLDKLARNPCENMIQLLVHPDNVFYALLRESPPDDILNEPQRKTLSSLKGPRGKLPSPQPRPSVWYSEVEEAGSPVCLQSEQLCLLEVKGAAWTPSTSENPNWPHTERICRTKNGLGWQREREGASQTNWTTLFGQGCPFSLVFVLSLVQPPLKFRQGNDCKHTIISFVNFKV